MTITQKFDGPIVPIDFQDFEYNSRQLKMTVPEPVDNATHYGFYYRAMDKDVLIDSWAYNDIAGYVTGRTTDDQLITIDYSSSAMRFEAITVYPAAIWRDVNSLLIRFDPAQGRVLKRGASSFD
ncbi:MAG: hypothetical protein LUE10_02140 [Alistipes sp.]|nr:hypothetical protein [Alistipes sp.]